MAKKQRQPNLPQETLERARREFGQAMTNVPAQVQPGGEAPSAAVQIKRQGVQAVAQHVDLHSQYAYVLTDLRNMAILAACLLLVLVAFSFVI